MGRFALAPKKSLGQNFLTSEAALAHILEAARLTKAETVLEIGPGTGVLTKKLLEKAGAVVAVEKDRDLSGFLTLEFADQAHFTLVSQDILEFQPGLYSLTEGKYVLVANIPYYITGEILRKFLEAGPQPERMVLLVQKEVADRIVARDKRESILSISVKLFGTPKFISKVVAGSFFPKPNVDSAILLIENINRNLLPHGQEKAFFDILHRGFAHKRKLLKGNLECDEKILEECGIPAKSRAENLTVEQWLKLASKLK